MPDCERVSLDEGVISLNIISNPTRLARCQVNVNWIEWNWIGIKIEWISTYLQTRLYKVSKSWFFMVPSNLSSTANFLIDEKRPPRPGLWSLNIRPFFYLYKWLVITSLNSFCYMSKRSDRVIYTKSKDSYNTKATFRIGQFPFE